MDHYCLGDNVKQSPERRKPDIIKRLLLKRFVLLDCIIIINDQLAFVKSCTVVVVGDSEDDVLGVCANGQTELGGIT